MRWDETKRRRVIAERGVDMLYASLIFEGVVLTKVDNRRDYGEVREISVGMVGDECFVVVHTHVDNQMRLVTAWKGGRRTREQYEKGIAGRNQENG